MLYALNRAWSFIVHVQQLLESKRVLLLQGPMGGFFKLLAEWLSTQKIECYKVNFNAGDWLFYTGDRVAHYRGQLGHFDQWLKGHIQQHQIDAVVCFGDCRFYHQIAKKVSNDLGKRFFVFEEGYVRPNYITFEENGVNDFSQFKRFFIQANNSIPDLPMPDHPLNVNPSYSRLIRTAIFYYVAWIVCFWLYPFYQHHRLIHPLLELFYWARSGVRRAVHHYREPRKFLNLIQHRSHQYFIVALQVHNDSQIRVHSDYHDVREFIAEVMQSFAQHAEKSHTLVLKHHPMDRGYRHYGRLIRQLAKQYGIQNRVVYFCDVHLPTLMKHSLGMVTINSTTGIQSLHHGKPVIALGRAIYNLDKLTYQHGLDRFWMHPGRVNKLHYRRFRYALVRSSQLNGSYNGLNPWMLDVNQQSALKQLSVSR